MDHFQNLDMNCPELAIRFKVLSWKAAVFYALPQGLKSGRTQGGITGFELYLKRTALR